MVLEVERGEDRAGHQGVAVPRSVGWGLAVWCLTGSVILQPTPLLLGPVPALLLIRSARSTAG
ncbi:hypothetical protein [Kitasatospora sp. NPDC001527]|uniref:hypothetical protein n=1 Tax=Kitasatospora sp. NPDC001527 TaxID=3154519 RepID=UPI003330D815